MQNSLPTQTRFKSGFSSFNTVGDRPAGAIFSIKSTKKFVLLIEKGNCAYFHLKYARLIGGHWHVFPLAFGFLFLHNRYGGV